MPTFINISQVYVLNFIVHFTCIVNFLSHEDSVNSNISGVCVCVVVWMGVGGFFFNTYIQYRCDIKVALQCRLTSM